MSKYKKGLACEITSRELLETWKHMHSCLKDLSYAQTKSQVDPCTNHWDYPVT